MISTVKALKKKIVKTYVGLFKDNILTYLVMSPRNGRQNLQISPFKKSRPKSHLFHGVKKGPVGNLLRREKSSVQKSHATFPLKIRTLALNWLKCFSPNSFPSFW